jgi:hypothetical protein
MFITPRSFLPSFPTRIFKLVHFKSFVLGGVIALALFGREKEAEAINFGEIASSVQKLVKIKKNLDGDVKALTADAKTLFGDKDTMLQIKDQLIRLATETRAQIDQVQTLVGVVEGHIKQTQADIAKTDTHVKEIDAVRKALEGN